MAGPASLRGLLRAPAPGGLVLRSVSDDVYRNLALEDWVHEHADLEGRPVLLLWRNSPSVVVGRHQNAWRECDLRLLRERGVRLARRKSGGGAVFHDLGNVNLTFFTTRREHDRRAHLGLVAGALRALQPRLAVTATERGDLLLADGRKVSGAAARLGRTAAYHHCTLLCAADRALLAAVLAGRTEGLACRATRSVPAPVGNLREADPALTWERVAGAVAAAFAAARRAPGDVVPVDPADEAAFPGIGRGARELGAWDWVYGRSPPFRLRADVPVPPGGPGAPRVGVDVAVRAGRVEACRLRPPPAWLPAELCDELAAGLAGRRFRPGEAARVAAPGLARHDGEVGRRWSLLCRSLDALM
ncbi:lipoyltransferase 1, mitochondrial [Ornithorhynchus anatinus]|uniref:Lipoyltransferase 1 n=1 Tax=Ornithorhynchus anatinus TaxID=9258 RepID=A0A6I8NHL2_ORNAN|nr:lipoyltransferase 1, mitochondrial [Ornithorhynchus anatinus]XP_028935881.1 lipoyltransferase 1, mitochondrial [Ornithorhynchus anatinus]